MASVLENPQRNAGPIISPNSAATVRVRELSPDRQSAWVDALFGKFARTYGSTFASLWAGVPVEEVKAEWGASLGPYTGAQIAWAVEACKREHDAAPTLPKFIRLCQQAPRAERMPLLPDNGVPIPPGVAARLNTVSHKPPPQSLEQRAAWAVRFLERVASGETYRGAPLPLSCERNACEALTAIGARHLAPPAYVAMHRPVWAAGQGSK